MKLIKKVLLILAMSVVSSTIAQAYISIHIGPPGVYFNYAYPGCGYYGQPPCVYGDYYRPLPPPPPPRHWYGPGPHGPGFGPGPHGPRFGPGPHGPGFGPGPHGPGPHGPGFGPGPHGPSHHGHHGR